MGKSFNVKKKRDIKSESLETIISGNDLNKGVEEERLVNTHLINTEDEVKLIPVTELIPNPFNERTYYSDEVTGERAKSLEEIGQIQPIIVTINSDDPTKYTIIDGEYRFRGAKKAGITELKAIERQVTSELELYRLSRESNKERKSSSLFDQAMGYQNLLDKNLFPSRKALSEAEGLTETKTSRILSLCELPDDAKALIATKYTDIPLTTAYEAYKLWKELEDNEIFLEYCNTEIVGRRVGREEIKRKRESLLHKPKEKIKQKPIATFRNSQNKKVGDLYLKGRKVSLSISGETNEHSIKIVEDIQELISKHFENLN